MISFSSTGICANAVAVKSVSSEISPYLRIASACGWFRDTEFAQILNNSAQMRPTQLLFAITSGGYNAAL